MKLKKLDGFIACMTCYHLLTTIYFGVNYLVKVFVVTETCIVLRPIDVYFYKQGKAWYATVFVIRCPKSTANAFQAKPCK